MGERKVLNKYIPPDFDPSLVPRGKKLSSKDGTVPVRMMLPFSIQCETCHTFMYRGKKFNSKKEAVQGAKGKYLGIQRWRFYIKCTQCARPVTFLTDPQNADYEMESGGTRNYELNKDKAKTEKEISQEQEDEEELDPMKALENRVLDSQLEIAELDRLEEIKAMNLRHVQMLSKHGSLEETALAVLQARESQDGGGLVVSQQTSDLLENGLTADEEALVKSIQFGKFQQEAKFRRLTEEDEKEADDLRQKEVAKLLLLEQRQSPPPQTLAIQKPVIKVIAKRKRQENAPAATLKAPRQEKVTVANITQPTTVVPTSEGLGSLLGGYASSDESD